MSIEPIRRRMSLKASVKTSVSMMAVLIASAASASAQTAAPPQAAQAPATEEIVVTGSRIVRNGYEAPTPVTVVGVEELNDQAKQNVFDAVANLPTFSGNTTPAT